MQIILFYVNSIDENLAKLRIIKSIDKLSNSTFPCTWFSNKSYFLFLVNFKRNSFQNPSFFSCRVSKPYISEFNFSSHCFRGSDNKLLICCFYVNFRRFVNNCKDLFSRFKPFNSRRSKLLSISCSKGSEHNTENTLKDISSVKVFANRTFS